MIDPDSEASALFSDIVEGDASFLNDSISLDDFGVLRLPDTRQGPDFSNLDFGNGEYGVALSAHEFHQITRLALEFYKSSPRNNWFLRFRVTADLVVVEGDDMQAFFRLHLHQKPMHFESAAADTDFVLSVDEFEAASWGVSDSALIKIGEKGPAQLYSNNFQRPLQHYSASKFGARFIKKIQAAASAPSTPVQASAELGHALSTFNRIFADIGHLDDPFRSADLSGGTLFGGTKSFHLHLSSGNFKNSKLVIPRPYVGATSASLAAVEAAQVSFALAATTITAAPAELAFLPIQDLAPPPVKPADSDKNGVRIDVSPLLDFIKRESTVFPKGASLSLRAFEDANRSRLGLELISFDPSDKRLLGTVLDARNPRRVEFEVQVSCRALAAVIAQHDCVNLTIQNEGRYINVFLGLHGRLDCAARLINISEVSSRDSTPGA
jgi:hypothetical protein